MVAYKSWISEGLWHFSYCLVITASLCHAIGVSPRPPVILVPGLAGSVLEEKLDRITVPAWYCAKTADWHVVWFSFDAASRPTCFLDELAVSYNSRTGRYRNQSGVGIRPYDWGGLGGVKALDPGLPEASGLFSTLVDALEQAGYRERRDLYGAPFDFRLAPDGLSQVGFYENLTDLVETAVKRNGRAAVIITHSMGGLVIGAWLAHMPRPWRSKHVAAFIPISAPFGGTVSAVLGSVSGNTFDIRFLPHNLLRPIQSTSPSGPFLFPQPDLWGTEVIVELEGGRKYTAHNFVDLLHDLGLKQQEDVYPHVVNLTWPPTDLGLPVYCIFGEGVPTDERYIYEIQEFNKSDPPAPKFVQLGPGDGSVNARSLEACQRFGKLTSVVRLQNASHTAILSDIRAIGTIVDMLLPNKTAPWEITKLSESFWLRLWHLLRVWIWGHKPD
eukprot:jgi/Botrbrau1/17701/Bobra.0166s0125.1